MALRLLYFLHFGAMGVYLPFYPVWLERLGLGGFRMSVILALLPALSIVAPSGFGALADAFGWRGSLLRVATLGAALSALLLLGASLLDLASNFWVVFFATLGFAFFRTPLQLSSEVLALEDPGSYGRVRMWGSIGFMLVALALGRLAMEGGDWLLPATLSLLLFATHLSSFGLPKSAPLPERAPLETSAAALKSASFRALLGVSVLGHAAHTAYEMCISLRLADMGVSGGWIGFAWMLATLSEVLLMAASPRLFARFSAPWLLLWSLVVGVGRWLFLAEVESLGWFLLLQPLHAITFGLRWVASIELVRRFAPRGSIATTQGLFLTATAIGAATGMLVWGTLYGRLGSGVFLGAAAVSTVACLVALRLVALERSRTVVRSHVPWG